MSEECDHKDKWHIAPGPYKIVRFCGGCGKSWCLPARDDMLGMGPDDRIIQEWEEIGEPVKVEQVVVGDYDESAVLLNDIYDEMDGDSEDEEG